VSKDPIDLDAERAKRRKPFKVRCLGDLQGKKIPPRDWLIPSVVMRRTLTMFSGDGGVGKSLMMMQLQVAAALGVDWLGIPMDKPIPSFGFYCEDDDDELDRRFLAICNHYGASFEDVGDLVRYCSRVGEEDNELIEFRGKGDFGRPTKTETFKQIVDDIREWGSQLIILDTLSDIFAGNENIRYQAKACTSALRSLSLINNGGVVLNTHPSKSAMADGSGFSGNTGWKGGVRNQILGARIKRESEYGEEHDVVSDERLLKFKKSNYGPDGSEFRIRWQDGVFVRCDTPNLSLLDKIEAKQKLLEACRHYVSRGMFLSSLHRTKTSLSAKAAELPSCKKYSFATLRWAQEQLEGEKKLVSVEIGPQSKRRVCIRPADMTYPGEGPLEAKLL
jgi:RecA-family ATPase